MNIVIATTNRHKLAEYQQLFASHHVVSLLDFPGVPDVAETADTFEGNAALKAEAISKLLGVTVIADDSGLCVTALNGAPGVKSARYAGDHDDSANNAKLLAELDGATDRSAHGLHYRVVPPPLRWRGTLGQPKAGGLFFNQSKFWLDNGAAAWYTRGVNQSRRI